MRRKKRCLLAMLAPAIFFLTALLIAFPIAPAWAARPEHPRPVTLTSHARIVSLTFVEGTVLIRRAGFANWIRAASNTPVEEGTSLATSRRSFAEVEFEDGSTVRIGEFSRLEFTQLVIAPRSGRYSRMTLGFGRVTMSAAIKHGEEYALDAGDVLLRPEGKVMVRADFAPGRLRVEVFRGHVRVAASKVSGNLAKNQTLIHDGASADPVGKSGEIQRDDWDAWVDARDQQAKWEAYNQEADTGGLMYGWSQELFPFDGLGAPLAPSDQHSQK
jgi:ferric-dicitrate binding protein FerR (iron transport regulator)